MIKKIAFSLLLTSTIFAGNESYKDQLKAFQEYKQSQEEQFQAYKEAQEKAFKEYKKELGEYWEEPKLSSKKEWVTYTDDKKTRTDVDFEKETVKIETIAKSEEEAKQKLNLALAKAVIVDTKTALKTDPLEKKLNKIAKPPQIVDGKPDTKPILKNIVFNKQPTKKDVVKYVTEKTKKIVKKESSKKKGQYVYSVEIQLPKNSTFKRSKEYLTEVSTHAKKQKIPLDLVFAIMHSESSFNPMARSHVPAFGLMQIVPKTAGKDAYNYLYREKKLVSSSYLYNAQNNITMGTAYLHILYYSYLRKIKNPTSRLYCTIAAYNTGAGNIAYAFNRYDETKKYKYNMNKAAPKINAMTPEQVYNKLLKDLRWDEPKHYLKNVSKRMKKYKEIYKQS